jgi:membrane associated rhomboid family serine protease
VTSLAVAFLMTDGGVEPLDDSLPFENVPRLVVSGEFFRLVTANWVHSDLLHLGFNAAALLIIGWTLEPLLGRPRMLLIGLTSGVLGALAFFPVAPEPYSSSVGSSAWAFGWIGCGLFLRVLRADSLPPILRVRVPWIGAGLFTALHLGFDDMPTWVQHAAGFAVGLVAALLLVSKQSIRTHSRRASALQAVAAGLVVAGAFAWSTASAALRGERNRTLLTRWIVEDESVDGAVLNDAAWAAAVDPGASPERLALAERLVRRALELDSDEPYFIGTLSTVLYRREKLDEAVETAWTRLQRLQDPFALEQAARFELARQRRLGPQREGAGSEGDVELECVTGAGEPPHLRLRAKDLFAEGLAVHAVAVRNGKPAAHARVWIGPRLGPGDVLDLAIPSEADSAFPGAQLVVTRIEVPPGVASGEVRSEVRALGSLTAGLP